MNNENELLFSVICPAFNASAFLKDAVRSVIDQEYKRWELIIVDDGSAPEFAKYYDDLAVLDKRIRVIHKNNQGPDVAREQGAKIALGDYVVFLDSDDLLFKEALMNLYSRIISFNFPDMVVYRDIVFSTEIPSFRKSSGVSFITGNQNCTKELFINRISKSMWSKAIKTTIFNKSSVPEQFSSALVGEDFLRTFECSKYVQTLLITDDYLYGYRQVSSSSMHNISDSSYFTYLLIFRYVYSELSQFSYSNHIFDSGNSLIINYFLSLLNAQYSKSHVIAKISDVACDTFFSTILKKYSKSYNVPKYYKRLNSLLVRHNFSRAYSFGRFCVWLRDLKRKILK